MIKLKPIYEINLIKPSDLIFITPNGKEAVNNFWNLNTSLGFFDLYESRRLFGNDFQDWVARGQGGELLKAAFNLSILVEEQIIEFDQKLTKFQFIKNWQEIYGTDENPFNKEWIIKFFKQGLLAGKYD